MNSEDKEKQIPGIEIFGMVKINDKEGWRPVLQRQATGKDACTRCSGFGTYGNPLCGAVYTCKECQGSGLRQPGQTVVEAVTKSVSWWKKLLHL